MLEARGITKRYPGVTALDGVDFSVSQGEIVALIGENGAGKSTLIKILGGLVAPDAGDIFVRDPADPSSESRRVLRSAAEASALGIGLIHQELNNLDNLDLAGNIYLGREPRKFGWFLDQPRMRRDAARYLNMLGLDLAPTTSLASLSIAQQQMVEIAKALSQDARYLIMDEPTSSLTAGETERLMQIAEDLRVRGVGIVYVSHRLNEVKRLADRVVVLRDGKNAGALAGPAGGNDDRAITSQNMVRLMVGRELAPATPRVIRDREVRLKVQDLRTARFPTRLVSFEIKAGEIVGLAGLVGAGRSEIARALFGVDPRVGEVILDGTPIPAGRVDAAIDAGLYLAPEDRRLEGLVTSMSITHNITLPDVSRYATVGLLSRRKECAVAEEMKTSLSIRTPSVDQAVSNLSGGNQQKVVLAKWLAMRPSCMVFDEPTRGVDIGARAEVYELMATLAAEGVAILMISSDMEEILAMSDRIIVMQEGRMTGELLRREATEEAVMKLAVGHA